MRKSLCISFVIIVTLFLYISSCSTKTTFEEFKTESQNIRYKLISLGNSVQAKKGNVVLLKAKYSCNNDSLFWTSEFDAGAEYLLRVNDSIFGKETWRFILENFSEGDSIQMFVNPEIFFRDVFNLDIPQFVKKNFEVKIELKIQRVMDSILFTKYLQDADLRREAAAYTQKINIENFLKKSKEKYIKIDSLIYFSKIDSSDGSSVKSGAQVSVSYKGCFLNGRVLDQVDEKSPLEFTFGQSKQLIRGLEMTLSKLRKGESAKIIIPSHLGFGNEGNARIPPYTPLLYELRVEDVK